MRVLLGVIALLGLALTLQAETELPFGVSGLDFGGVTLGQAPDKEMVCTRGPCFSVEGGEAVEIPQSRQYVFSIYKKPLDITHYGRVEVAAPQYYFYDNQLFQILVKVQCAADELDSCLDRITAQLNEDYELKPGYSLTTERSVLKEFRTESGAVITVSYREQIPGEPDWPTVKIYDKTLMDQVRGALNPNYVPAEYR